jgi:hypothetical protein
MPTTPPEKFVHKLSQDELLKQIEKNFETENIQMAPAFIVDSGAEGYDLEKLHVRNFAQVKHTTDTEKTAIAHWAE